MAGLLLGCATLLPAEIPTPSPLAEADSGLPTWTTTVDLKTGAGYRRNLLLSPTGAENSSLVRAELEVLALKVPVGHFDGYAYATFTETRFLADASTDHERTAIVAGEARWQPPSAVKAGWSIQAYHQDQVFDVSLTEAELSTAQLKITGFATGPNVAIHAGPGRLEARLIGRRDRYARELDGYDEGEGSLKLAFPLGERLGFALTGSRRERHHDSRPQFTVSGRPISGSLLETTQSGYQADLVWTLDPESKRRLTATGGEQTSRDNGSGYFDYQRDFARLQFADRTDRWEYEITGEFNDYRFPSQFIGIGIDPELRRKSEVRLAAEVSRELTDRLAAFLAVEHERSTSNDDRSRFTTATYLVGLKLSWDSLDSLLATP